MTLGMFTNVAFSLLVGVSALGAESLVDGSEYEPAVMKAGEAGGSFVVRSLRKCIENWERSGIERLDADATDTFRAALQQNRSVILEIGGTTWPKYEYVRINGFILSSSKGQVIDISDSELAEYLSELYADPEIEHAGRSKRITFDGSCYFLTVNGEHESASVAVYGQLGNSSASELIGLLIAAAKLRE